MVSTQSILVASIYHLVDLHLVVETYLLDGVSLVGRATWVYADWLDRQAYSLQN